MKHIVFLSVFCLSLSTSARMRRQGPSQKPGLSFPMVVQQNYWSQQQWAHFFQQQQQQQQPQNNTAEQQQPVVEVVAEAAVNHTDNQQQQGQPATTTEETVNGEPAGLLPDDHVTRNRPLARLATHGSFDFADDADDDENCDFPDEDEEQKGPNSSLENTRSNAAQQ